MNHDSHEFILESGTVVNTKFILNARYVKHVSYS